VRIFNTAGTRAERKMQPHGSPVTKIAFSADGSMLLSGSGDGMLAVSSVSSGLVVRVIQDHHGAPITDLCVASNPVQLSSLEVESVWLWLAASGDRRVSVWSADWSQDVCLLLDWLSFPGPACAPNGTKLRRGDKCQYDLLPHSLARFSPTDPDIILYTGYGLERCVQFYSISQKTVLRTYAITHWATCMDVSPQGHLIALGCSERVLKLMDYSEGSFQDFSGHQDTVSCVVFSLSGRSLISTSDSIVHVWRLLH
jgi:WD40 repeat protein